MNHGELVEVSRQALSIGLAVCLPLLGATLVIGVLVSVFQAVTQIQEASLTFVPKVLVTALIVAGAGSWMLSMLVKLCDFCLRQGVADKQ